MKQTVEAFIRKHHMLKKGETIVVAVSGGPDSMALLHLLHEMKHSYGLQLVAAHVNHRLRGDESDEDEKLVKSFCEEKGIRCETTNIEWRKAGTTSISLQAEARTKRYDCLARVMELQGADTLATAHHGDDQVETVIMKQGTGRALFGQIGIPSQRSFAGKNLIRPLLPISKDDIYAYCSTYGVPYRQDSSNVKTTYTRNRFRKVVLPFLKNENSSIHRHIQQYVEWTEEDRLLLEELAKKSVDDVMIAEGENYVTISIPLLKKQPLPLQRRVIHLILKYLTKENNLELSFIHIEDFFPFIEEGQPGKHLDWPHGIKVNRSYDSCTFSVATPMKDSGEQSGLDATLHVPGNIEISDYDFSAEFIDHLPEDTNNPALFVCPVERVHLPLRIRTRRPGDRLQPLGMKGTQKLNRVFINEKVDRDKRDHWPVLTDSMDNILWLPFLKKSSMAYIKQASPPFLKIECRRT